MLPALDRTPVSVKQRWPVLGGLAIAVALAFIVVGGAVFRSPEKAKPGTSDANPVASDMVVDQAVERSIPQKRAASPSPASVVPSTFVPSDIATATVVVSAGNLMAISQEDKAWLAKHGYPTLTEVEWSKQATLDELKAASRSSTRFAALYGERLWEQNHYREGRAVLIDALVSGSLYAAEAIALRTLRDGDQGNGANSADFEAAAWWFYATQMGNYHASDAVTNNMRGLGADSLGQAMSRSFAIAQEIDAARAASGLPPALRDPRPSFDLYADRLYRRETTVVPR